MASSAGVERGDEGRKGERERKRRKEKLPARSKNERSKEREEERAAAIPLSRGIMPRTMAVYVCVCGFAHAHSYWSYFMAKLFWEKNNSISQHIGYGSRHPRSCIRICWSHLRIRNVDRRTNSAFTFGSRYWRISIIIWKMKRRTWLVRKIDCIACFAVSYIYETRTMIRMCDKLYIFMRHARPRFLGIFLTLL